MAPINVWRKVASRHAAAVRRSPPEAESDLSRRHALRALPRGGMGWPPYQPAHRPMVVPQNPGALPSAPLVTTGARTARPREVQLAYFHDGSDPILIASNYGGPKHPQWYYNLKAHPQCEFGDERFVATEVTDPDEHTRLLALAEKIYAGYADYRAATALVGRQIPIFRLKPR